MRTGETGGEVLTGQKSREAKLEAESGYADDERGFWSREGEGGSKLGAASAIGLGKFLAGGALLG